LSANLIGCFVMGLVAQLIASTAWFNDAGIIPDQYRLLFAVGFCGSFTTLSSMVLELNTMIQKNELFYSFTYLVGTLVGGFACFYLGIVIMRAVLQLQSS
jgi:CrcB protein